MHKKGSEDKCSKIFTKPVLFWKMGQLGEFLKSPIIFHTPLRNRYNFGQGWKPHILIKKPNKRDVQAFKLSFPALNFCKRPINMWENVPVEVSRAGRCNRGQPQSRNMISIPRTNFFTAVLCAAWAILRRKPMKIEWLSGCPSHRWT